MNKVFSKKIMLESGIPTAKFKEALRKDGTHQQMPFDFPMIVKPTSGGSSVGMTIAHNAAELEAGLAEASALTPAPSWKNSLPVASSLWAWSTVRRCQPLRSRCMTLVRL
ncbi:ATP-binding protein [Lacticaseibacillus thailandensis]|uniref:ATP-binding protein n=1 Tax=Lacticaseibacillus thailandensis TaxID=381741 RepID=UPI001CDAC0AF|nr:hypothetical protein [Lacticaseibacillus thailandensis]